MVDIIFMATKFSFFGIKKIQQHIEKKCYLYKKGTEYIFIIYCEFIQLSVSEIKICYPYSGIIILSTHWVVSPSSVQYHFLYYNLHHLMSKFWGTYEVLTVENDCNLLNISLSSLSATFGLLSRTDVSGVSSWSEVSATQAPKTEMSIYIFLYTYPSTIQLYSLF